MSGQLILLNDINTSLDTEGLLFGDGSLEADKIGYNQATLIGAYINNIVPKIDIIVNSGAANLKILLHKIRSLSKDKYLTKINVLSDNSLRERDFGVLSATKFELTSDIFSHTKILPEQGESVAKCRDRGINWLRRFCETYREKVCLAVSHPFVCQIICNVLLQKNHCLLSPFWQKKGSFIIFSYELGEYGTTWRFISGHNGVDQRQYTEEEINRPVFA